MRQLRNQESDYSEALNAKDSQLAVLRVRIQEADQEMVKKKEQLNELQLQREKYDPTLYSMHQFLVSWKPGVMILDWQILAGILVVNMWWSLVAIMAVLHVWRNVRISIRLQMFAGLKIRGKRPKLMV